MSDPVIVPITAIPNQDISFIGDGNQWNLGIKLVNDAIAVTLTMNGVLIQENARAVTNMRILQSQYQQNGNFAIVATNQTVPDYTQFGVTQFLIYIPIDELAISQSPPQTSVPESYFDPIAPLPLRFAPQGYVQVGG